MKVYFIDLPIVKDNDLTYFSILEAVVNSIDELSTLEIRKNTSNYSFRLSLSEPIYISPLIKELNSLHNMMKIRVDFSKSIKSSYILHFKINLVE